MITFNVYNLTRGSVLASEVELADSVFSRLKGLLGRKDLPDKHGMVLKPCKQIHSWFMKFPFDAVFVSKDGNVVYLRKNMSAYRTTPYIRKAWQVIELPAGTIEATGTQINDHLLIRKEG